MYNIEVLMSSYNGEKFISEQLNSIFNQKECNVHVLVRDDGSTDSTLSILEDYANRYNLDYYSGENLKPAKSFMHLVKHCNIADFYAFADQDDIWYPDKLIRAISVIKNSEVDNLPIAYCSNLTPVYDSQHIICEKLLGEKIADEYTEILSRSSDIFGCTMVWNRDLQTLLTSIGTPNMQPMHDYWVALIASCYGRLIYDKIPSIMYRQHEDNKVGAGLSELNNWKGRLSWIFKKTKESSADIANEMIKVMKNCSLPCPQSYVEYTHVMAKYKVNFFNKFRYLKIADMRAMSFKQKCFHVILTLTGSL
ncbi:glycosyltransferase [Drancourtella massiliensis]|uniref:Glycosyltransferase n=1 Tax=Drancourtella massiliensis TaxID=1632013 RepID=A0ABS2EH84_9FIRM|nr:glycosyltransferase [Drancourtella massiliensis]MBM6744345.1 glycosyltransferase [Drancourtella massiliensis]